MWAGPAAAECGPWVNDRGDQISTVEDFDYEYRYVRAGGSETLCLTLRNPEQTSLVCEDGTDDVISLVASDNAMSFDDAIWKRDCD
jgi:hypothetical protein